MNQIEEIMARAMAPLAWAALGTGDTLAQLNRRKASLRHARAALHALEAAGFVVVPKEPTPEMISTAAPLAARAPGERDFAIALTAVSLLPPNEHPDIADVLAQMAVDYRAMIEARLK